eukprot:UN25266
MFAARLAKEYCQNHQNSAKGREHQNLVKLLVDYGANCDLLNDINENLWDIVATYPDFKEKLQEARRVYERRQQNQKDKLEKLNRSKEMAAAHQSFDFDGWDDMGN